MQRKIKIFTEKFPATLEYTVDEFIKTHTVVDIQYRYVASDHNKFSHSVMIVYEEW